MITAYTEHYPITFCQHNHWSFCHGIPWSTSTEYTLWGAIYIIHGGCGDDSFNDFREWVIGQGKDFYYKTIKDPESLVDFDTDTMDEIEWEGMGYVPSTVFEEITEQEMPYPFKEQIETTGTEWAEESDDLKNLFPKLCAKFPDHV